MRARVRLLGSGLSTRMLGGGRVCSVVLFPAVVAMAAAIGAPDAAVASADWRWEGRRHAPHAVRYGERWEAPQRQRKRVSRAGHRQRYASSRRRPRVAAVRPTRAQPQWGRPAPRLVAASPAAETLPMQQRSLVASHPLLPNVGPLDILAGPAEIVAGTTVPRCRSAHPNVFALAVEGLMRGLHLSEPAMVEGAWPHCRGASHPQTSWRHASLGRPARDGTRPAASTGLATDSPIHWRASAECLASPLRAVLNLLVGEFGPLTVNSTCRSPGHNRRVGGATRSRHLTGDAVDFRVRGSYREVHAFLKRMRSVGGLAHYGSGVFHIDTGPRRTWAPGSWHRAGVRRGRGA